MRRNRRREPEPARDRRKSGRRFLPRLLGVSGGIALAAGGLCLFARQARKVAQGATDEGDADLIERMQAAHGPSTDRVMALATHVGSHPSVATAAIVTAIVLGRKGRSRDAWTLLISTGGAMVTATALKAIFERERPADLNHHIALPKSKSFPSAHSFMATATWPILAQALVESEPPVARLTAQAAAGVLIATIGTSRVYFGVHYPSDVIAGLSGGLGWLGLTSISHTLAGRGRDRP